MPARFGIDEAALRGAVRLMDAAFPQDATGRRVLVSAHRRKMAVLLNCDIYEIDGSMHYTMRLHAVEIVCSEQAAWSPGPENHISSTRIACVIERHKAAIEGSVPQR